MTKQESDFYLEQRLAAIGVMVASDELSPVDLERIDIEDTLVAAFFAIENDERKLRLLGPVFSWIEIHGSAVIVEKLVKLLKARRDKGQDVSLAALAGSYATSRGQRRWASLKVFSDPSEPPKLVGPSDMAESLLDLRGEEEWAKNSGRRLPKGVIQIDPKWTLSKEALAKLNRQYRNRLIYGPQWRADIVTAVERGATTPAEASRISGASYEPCHRVLAELAAADLLPTTKARKVRAASRSTH